MKKLHIRLIRKEEIQQLVQLFALHAAYEKTTFKANDQVKKLTSYLFQENPPCYCLVALLGEELIGYASYMKQFSTWDSDFYIYMDCLFLKEEARGMGIGQQFMTRIKTEAVRLGCAHIQWQTPQFNEKAIQFYKKIGATSKAKERFFLQT